MQVGARVHLDSLTKLGLEPRGVDELRKALEKVPADAARVDYGGALDLGTVAKYAKQLGRTEVIDALDRVFSSARPTRAAHTLTVKPEDLPQLRVSSGEARALSPGSGQIPLKTLEPFRASLAAFAAHLEKSGQPSFQLTDPVDARALAGILEAQGHRLRNFPSVETGLMPRQITQLADIAGRALLPATSERELVVDVPSTFKPLAERGGAKVFHKVQLDSFSVVRGEAVDGRAPLTLQGFVGERLAIQVPKGHAVFVIDAAGNELAPRATRTKRAVAGAELELVELTRSQLGQDGKGPVTVKVVDPSGKAILEDTFGFATHALSNSSRRLAEGSVGYQPIPPGAEDPLTRWALDHAVGEGARSTTPYGRRPSLALGDAVGDRLSIRRDGERHDVDELARFLAPPRSRAQAFLIKEGGHNLTVTLGAKNPTALDEKADETRLPFDLKSSRGAQNLRLLDSYPYGDGWTELGIGGFTRRAADGSVSGRFDPLDPAQERNPPKR